MLQRQVWRSFFQSLLLRRPFRYSGIMAGGIVVIVIMVCSLLAVTGLGSYFQDAARKVGARSFPFCGSCGFTNHSRRFSSGYRRSCHLPGRKF